jgi:thioredoxin reductase (NADPH)
LASGPNYIVFTGHLIFLPNAQDSLSKRSIELRSLPVNIIVDADSKITMQSDSLGMEEKIGTALRRRRGFDVAVIGGGIAGLTAAWSAARHGLTTVVFEGAGLFGGQIATLGHLEDYPSANEMSGVDLAISLVDAARAAGVIIVEQEVASLDAGDKLFELALSSGPIRARNVIVATGARLRKLGVPGASQFEGRGVSQCATCDGAFFRGQDVVVIGGGDAALQEALTLAPICKSVFVVARSRLKARQAFIDAAASRANLNFVWESEPEAVLGENGVSAVRVRHLKTGSTTDISCFGVFPFIGVEPNTGFLDGVVAFSESGHIKTDAQLRSSQPGIYAIGAVRNGHSGALASAAGDAAAVVRQLAHQLRP